MKYVIVFLLATILAVSAKPTFPGKEERASTCGYDACSTLDFNQLNVHVIPHSHDDVGWLKTVDQYYYGNRNNIQRAGVQYIIDSYVEALKLNPERRFIQVESAFLWKWWIDQDEPTRQQYRDLVNSGRIEMIGGAWSMNDEAASNYQSIIDQFTWGLRWLNDSFGECGRPKVGWQIDPFGHSREQASIFSQMGFDGLFFGRLDWRDKNERLSTKTGELIWQGSANSGNKSNLFTGAMYNTYFTPAGFCYDIECQDEPIIDDKESPDYNLKTKVEGYADFIKDEATHYKTNNILITMGGDFQYQAALVNFVNMDKLLSGFTEFPQQTEDGRQINVLYSTPGCYLKAVNDEAALKGYDFALKTDDFFPYASDEHSNWSGYFTSRPTQKRFERQGNNLLQVSKQLTSFLSNETLDTNLQELRRAMGIMQHHDAITGTEKQHVAQDYARLLKKAIDKTHLNINSAVSILLDKNPADNATINLELNSCLLSNVSYCKESQAKRFVVTVYNPLSRSVSHYVRLPVSTKNFTITGPNGAAIKYQVTPSIADFSYVENITPSKFDLVFLANDLPPQGLRLYYVEANDPQDSSDIPPDTSANRFSLGNSNIGAALDPSTGRLSSVTINNVSLPVQQNFMYYLGAKGNNTSAAFRASGAYIFRPSPDSPNALPFGNLTTTVYKGELVDEAHQTVNNWVKQIIRVYKTENHVEFDWIVGPINIDDSEGKEIISRFSSNINNGDIFYTDSNGREILKRTRNFRPSYNYTNEEPVSGNYYPVNAHIHIRDTNTSMGIALLNERSQGGSSLANGELELMVHRRLLLDDSFGVNEALNETEFGQGMVARGQHFLTHGPLGVSIDSIKMKQREIAQRKLLSPWVFVGDASASDKTLAILQQNLNFEFAGMTRPLSNQVQVLTLEPWKNGDILLRLEHLLEVEESGTNVSVDLEGLFTKFNITALKETTLAANQWLENNQRLSWNVGSCISCDEAYSTNNLQQQSRGEKAMEVTLSPMQIRTFVATIKRN